MYGEWTAFVSLCTAHARFSGVGPASGISILVSMIVRSGASLHAWPPLLSYAALVLLHATRCVCVSCVLVCGYPPSRSPYW